MPTVRTVSKTIPIILLFLFIFIWPGCSVKKNYKTLALFFDGVPKPGETAGKEKDDGKKTDSQPSAQKQETWVKIVSRHPAYAERECKECHNVKSLTFLKEQAQNLCFTCHDREDFQGAYLHGPVAAGGCLTCHLPHESKYKSLLKEEGVAMCFYCHDKADVKEIKGHASHMDSKKNKCTRCHNPHTAENPFFLVGMKDEG